MQTQPNSRRNSRAEAKEPEPPISRYERYRISLKDVRDVQELIPFVEWLDDKNPNHGIKRVVPAILLPDQKKRNDPNEPLREKIRVGMAQLARERVVRTKKNPKDTMDIEIASLANLFLLTYINSEELDKERARLSQVLLGANQKKSKRGGIFLKFFFCIVAIALANLLIYGAASYLVSACLLKLTGTSYVFVTSGWAFLNQNKWALTAVSTGLMMINRQIEAYCLLDSNYEANIRDIATTLEKNVDISMPDRHLLHGSFANDTTQQQLTMLRRKANAFTTEDDRYTAKTDPRMKQHANYVLSSVDRLMLTMNDQNTTKEMFEECVYAIQGALLLAPPQKDWFHSYVISYGAPWLLTIGSWIFSALFLLFFTSTGSSLLPCLGGMAGGTFLSEGLSKIIKSASQVWTKTPTSSHTISLMERELNKSPLHEEATALIQSFNDSFAKQQQTTTPSDEQEVGSALIPYKTPSRRPSTTSGLTISIPAAPTSSATYEAPRSTSRPSRRSSSSVIMAATTDLPVGTGTLTGIGGALSHSRQTPSRATSVAADRTPAPKQPRQTRSRATSVAADRTPAPKQQRRGSCPNAATNGKGFFKLAVVKEGGAHPYSPVAQPCFERGSN